MKKSSDKKSALKLKKSNSISSGKSSGKNKKSDKSKNSSVKEDIIELILKDHKPIKKMIEILKNDQAEYSEKRPAFDEFSSLLLSHAEPEQESLYARMKEEKSLREEAFEGDVEHALASQLIEEVKSTYEDQDLWMAKVKVLAELVEHHIEEEESEMLKQVKKQFDAETRYVIGQEYLNLRAEFEETHEPFDSSKDKKSVEIRAH